MIVETNGEEEPLRCLVCGGVEPCSHNFDAITWPNARFEVQQRCPLRGWITWVIYDEKRHADEECNRRISEAAPRDKNNWRVIPSPNPS